MKTTTICRGCDERISLYDGHVCRKYSEKYSDRTDSGWWNADGTYIPRDRSKFHQFGYSWHDHLTNPVIQPAIDAMNKIPVHIKQEPIDYDFVSQKFLAKQSGLDIAEEKRKIQEERYKEEMSGRVIEAMEKDKFIDGKTTYSGTLNECSTDLTTIKQLAGVDWGKENSKSVKMISELMPDESIRSFPMNNWENHPIYLELKNNINVKCKVDNKGKITGTVVSNLYLSVQWFLDFEKLCCLNSGVLSMSSCQSPDFQGLLEFQIQLVEYFTETRPAPKMMYEVGSDKPFYTDYAICNQCDQPNIYRLKMFNENYTCQKCWPR